MFFSPRWTCGNGVCTYAHPIIPSLLTFFFFRMDHRRKKRRHVHTRTTRVVSLDISSYNLVEYFRASVSFTRTSIVAKEWANTSRIFTCQAIILLKTSKKSREDSPQKKVLLLQTDIWSLRFFPCYARYKPTVKVATRKRKESWSLLLSSS